MAQPLSTLACCSTRTSLHVSTPGAKCSEEDINLLGRVPGLRELTLAFQGANENGSSVAIAPLFQLTNLQSLVLQGVVPSAAQVPLAAGGEGVGGASGEHGSSSNSNSHGFLPISLTSLEIQGKGWDDRGEATTTVKGWTYHISSGNQLKELCVRDFGNDACSSLFHAVDLSRLSVLKELHVLMEPTSDFDTFGWVQLPLGLTSLSHSEVLEISSSAPALPGQQYYLLLSQGQLGLLNHLPKLRKLGWMFNIDQLEVPAEAQLSKLEELRFYGRQLPAWLTAPICPQLKKIMIEGNVFSGVLQELAVFTQLTALRLDGGVAHATISQLERWGDMRVPGNSLHRLRRLELVNYAAAFPEGAERRS